MAEQLISQRLAQGPEWGLEAIAAQRSTAAKAAAKKKGRYCDPFFITCFHYLNDRWLIPLSSADTILHRASVAP
ncbi:MAG: hypothetical protein KJO85_07140 [Gammaproteobacteria bacterium]|nr:hypothetical protein [Gammaproteobacteria bacterium]